MWWRKKKTEPKPDAEAARQAALAAAESPGERAMPRSTIILLGLAGAAVTAWGLWATRSIVAPVLLSLVLTICVHPLRTSLERRGVPRGAATGSVVAAVFLLLAGFVAALVVALAQFATLLPQFAPQLRDAGQSIGDWLSGLGIGQAQIQAIVSGFDPANLASFVSSLFGSVASVTFSLVVVLTTLILMAMDASSLPTLFQQLRPKRSRLVVSLESYASGVRRYMVATTGLGIAQGILNALCLWALGVPGAFLWGLLTFICSFIPNIGYFIAIVPPLVFGYLVGGVPTLIWVVIVYGVINGIVQSVIQPRIVGNAVALSQTLTFVSVLFWAAVIGPVGAILAIPLTLLARTVLIDSDPDARWWRPILGDLSETRSIMKDADAERKARKKAVG
jgi:AI-2 transport protein TqsA